MFTNKSKEGQEDGNPEFLIEREYVHPLIRSSSLPILWLGHSHTDAVVIDIPTNEAIVKNTKASEYIKWGEKKGFNNRSVTKLQKPWWKAPIQARESGPLLWLRYHHNVHRAYYNPERLIGGDAFYRFYPFEESKTLALAAILNSTYIALWKEILGASSYGLGVLGTRMDSILLTPIPFLISEEFRNILTRSFINIAFRSVEPMENEMVKLDRRDLDNIVFDYFKLTNIERDAVYEAVINLVDIRLKKASSLEKPKFD